MTIDYQCEWCGKHVRKRRSPATLRGQSPRFCSQTCNGASRKGQGSGPTPNVMEKITGRLLTSSEVVHHINHVKTDNRPENLMLFANHSDHMKHHASEETNV